MNLDEINKQRDQLWKAYKEGRIDENELNSTLDILDEDKLRCRPPASPKPLTASERNSVLKFYVEIMAVIIIVLFVIVISRGCEISDLENQYAELQEDYEELEQDHENDCIDVSSEAYAQGYYDGYEDGEYDGFEKGYQTAEEDYDID